MHLVTLNILKHLMNIKSIAVKEMLKKRVKKSQKAKEITKIGRPRVSTDVHIRWNIIIHPTIKEAVKQMATIKNQSQISFLQNFFRDYILYMAKHTESEDIHNHFKKLLKEVPYL